MDLTPIILPLVLVCGLFGIVMAVGVVGSAFWYIDRDLRACAECGSKGTGYIVDTDTISSQTHMDYKGQTPMRVTEKHLIDHYECEECGHKWEHALKQKKYTPVEKEKRQ